MPKGPSKPKAKAQPKAPAKSKTPQTGRVASRMRPGAASTKGRDANGKFKPGNILGMRKLLAPAPIQEIQRNLVHDPARLARAFQLVDLHIELGNLDAAIFAIQMSCGRPPQSVAIQGDPIAPMTIALPDGYEPPPWMARKKVENTAEKKAIAPVEDADGQRRS